MKTAAILSMFCFCLVTYSSYSSTHFKSRGFLRRFLVKNVPVRLLPPSQLHVLGTGLPQPQLHLTGRQSDVHHSSANMCACIVLYCTLGAMVATLTCSRMPSCTAGSFISNAEFCKLTLTLKCICLVSTSIHVH